MPGKPGSFAAYLEYTQRGRATSPLSGRTAFRTALSRIEEPGDLLHVLSLQPEGSMTLGQLAGLCGLSAGAFHRMLKALSDAGLLSVGGPPLEETISLTPKGREVATLA